MLTGRHIGTLIVVVLKARNLPNKRHIGKQDPYCQVIFNDEKRRTKAIKRGGQHPEWDEEIRYELYEDVEELPTVPGQDTPPPPPPKSNGKGPPNVQGGRFMAIACYAEDPREPDLIGEAKVDLSEVLTKGETDEWFTIMSKDKYCGEVYLELTFWLNEPPPTKKVTPKPTNGQYGGRGTFVPMGDSASSSLTDLSRISSVSSRDDIRLENLPPSLRSGNSRLDIYIAPYESIRSHDSSVDGMMNEFAELRVDQGVNRRQSMPTGSYISPRPPSTVGAPVDHFTYPGGHQSTYSDGGGYPYEYGLNAYHHDSAPLPDPYQPAYEQTPTQSTPPAALPAPSGFTGHRPRYSMPPASSGFMPLPQPSGFVPLANTNTPQRVAGFLPPATPAPGAYGGQLVPSRVPSSSFSTLPPIASTGFVPGPLPSSYLPLSQSPSRYYPSASQNQLQRAPPPSSSLTSMPPTSSFPQRSPSTSYPQQLPLPPTSAPPGLQQPYPHSPSMPALQHHPHSAPLEQLPYMDHHHTPSPSHDNIPPPPHLADSPSNGQHTGSRPLPQPQPQEQTQPSYPPPQAHARRQSSLPVPPGPPPQSYYNGTAPPTFPSATPYQSIPPPPPLPPAQQPPPSFLNSQLAPPGPPPPLPSQSMLQEPAHPPPKRRPSLPPPPSGKQQQQSAFQAFPPPPPPPSLPSHVQYEYESQYTSNFSSTGTGQTYYPGPPPRPPQYAPVQHQLTGYTYSPPIPQDNYGQ